MGYSSELALQLEGVYVAEFIKAAIELPYFDVQAADRYDKNGMVLFYWEYIKNYEFDSVIQILKDLKTKYYILEIGENLDDIQTYGDYNCDEFNVMCCRNIQFDGE